MVTFYFVFVQKCQIIQTRADLDSDRRYEETTRSFSVSLRVETRAAATGGRRRKEGDKKSLERSVEEIEEGRDGVM